MARSKKGAEPGDGTRDGAEQANGAAEARSRGRGRTGTAARSRRAAPGDQSGGFPQELRAAQEQALRNVREGYDRLGKELTAATGRLAESIRHAQEQLADIVRQAHEARRDLVELRELARDAHREGLGEPAAGERAGAEAGGQGARRGRRAGEGREAGGRAGKESRAEARNRVGVTVGSGVVVAEVIPDSPAAGGGLRRGDVIEEVNGTDIISATHLRDAVRAAGEDADVSFRVVRAGDAQDLRVRVGKRPDDAADEGRNQLGVTVGPGVVVAEVLPDTPASAAGLERGDVIDDVNGTPVLSGEQFRQAVQQLPAGSEAVLRVTRAGQAREVRTRLDAAGG
jgi:hypothetical protein